MCNNNLISLDQAEIGDCIKIKRLEVTGTMRRRLLDLGFVPSAKVVAVQKSPLGDPIAYEVSQTIIALRKEESSKIFGEVVKNESKTDD
ncbi:FeoA family protein [Fervidibacillus halotolerans]|uniref:Ferrous iron transport protein A n=1 Tax=Fervidibacillus halotolerans TaxID=2980027 RepID=A0A9E8M2Y5_9BACI|nr:FeoA domain-containing protein [Fervidibacillus halotolerans]WAA13449.1 ferrous iron transport protein A [Fervidibacillus halotolerans]